MPTAAILGLSGRGFAGSCIRRDLTFVKREFYEVGSEVRLVAES